MTATTAHRSYASECIQDCLDTHRVCTEMVLYCLGEGGQQAEPRHIQRMLDCAELCQIAADLMMRESTLSSQACGLCALACLACADDCDRSTGDLMMRRCAEVCRHCAESCARMAS